MTLHSTANEGQPANLKPGWANQNGGLVHPASSSHLAVSTPLPLQLLTSPPSASVSFVILVKSLGPRVSRPLCQTLAIVNLAAVANGNLAAANEPKGERCTKIIPIFYIWPPTFNRAFTLKHIEDIQSPWASLPCPPLPDRLPASVPGISDGTCACMRI